MDTKQVPTFNYIDPLLGTCQGKQNYYDAIRSGQKPELIFLFNDQLIKQHNLFFPRIHRVENPLGESIPPTITLQVCFKWDTDSTTYLEGIGKIELQRVEYPITATPAEQSLWASFYFLPHQPKRSHNPCL